MTDHKRPWHFYVGVVVIVVGVLHFLGFGTLGVCAVLYGEDTGEGLERLLYGVLVGPFAVGYGVAAMRSRAQGLFAVSAFLLILGSSLLLIPFLIAVMPPPYSARPMPWWTWAAGVLGVVIACCGVVLMIRGYRAYRLERSAALKDIR